MTRYVLTVLVGLFIGVSIAHAAPYFRQETTIVPIDSTENIGTSTNRWNEGWFNNINVSGTCTGCSSGGSYPFPLAGNATSTLTQFNGGLTAYASSTIGAGGQTTGLTISGGATTTLMHHAALGYDTYGYGGGGYYVDDLLFATASTTNSATLVGFSAGASLIASTSAAGNTALGYRALFHATSSSYNTAVGYHALFSSPTISGDGFNTAVGYQALASTSGRQHTAVGYRALAAVTSAVTANTAVGYLAGASVTSGVRNVIIGGQAGDSVSSQSDLTIVGWDAGGAITTSVGSRNTAIGRSALSTLSTGIGNTAVGYFACGSNNTTSASSTCLGALSGYGNNVSYLSRGNTLIGAGAGLNLTNGSDDNTFLGNNTGLLNTSGYDNTFLGSFTGQSNTTGFNNLLIGWNANGTSSTAANFLNIGNLIFGTLPATTSATAFTLPTRGTVGIATSSPFAALAVHGINGSTNTTLFAVGSSTAAATTTHFSVNNVGSTTLSSLFGQCGTANALTTNSAGTIVCGAITGTGDGVGNWFTPTTNFNTAVNSTSTLTWFANGVHASSTSRFVTVTTYGAVTITDTTNSIVLGTGGGIELIRTSQTDSGFIDIKDSSGEDYDFRLQEIPNANRLTLNSSSTASILNIRGDGNVGIATTTPASRFSVQGSSLISGNLSLANLTATGTLTTVNLLAFGSSTIGDGTGAGGLTVSGNATTTGQIIASAGTAVTPSYAFLNDGDTGIYWTQAGIMGFVQNAAARFTFGGDQLMGSGVEQCWRSATTATAGATDTCISRLSAGVLQIGSGTSGNALGRLVLGTFGVGSTSPFAKSSIHANANDAVINQTLFAIASSTASATSTLFSISNTGTIVSQSTTGGVLYTTTIPSYHTKTFSYASSTQGSGTTTRSIGVAPQALTVKNIQCDFSNFMRIMLYDGTNRANDLVASSTIGTVTFTTNNSFVAGEAMRVDIGTTTNIAANVYGSCTMKYVYD